MKQLNISNADFVSINKGIQLFGISNRAYGSEADAFLVKLKANRPTMIKQVAVFALRNIDIK